MENCRAVNHGETSGKTPDHPSHAPLAPDGFHEARPAVNLGGLAWGVLLFASVLFSTFVAGLVIGIMIGFPLGKI